MEEAGRVDGGGGVGDGAAHTREQQQLRSSSQKIVMSRITGRPNVGNTPPGRRCNDFWRRIVAGL